MIKVAIIPAAGYKGEAERYHDTKLTGRYCPESLTPVGGGQTALSRLCSQLKQLGYHRFIGIGQPGTIYPIQILGLAKKHGIHQDINKSPWTWKRVDYVARQGIPILIHDPDRYVLPETVCRMIDVIGFAWDELLLISGDYVISDALLKDVLDKAPYPARVEMADHHNLWRMTPPAAAAFKEISKLYRRRDPNTIALGFTWKPGFDSMWERAGFTHVHAQEMFPDRVDAEFVEIESGPGMGKALALVAQYPHVEESE